MGESSKTLQDYRDEIDQIDDAIIALMIKRLGVVSQVRELKTSQGQRGLFLRSGREGSMIARIYHAFSNSRFCPAAASTMWRQMIGASTMIESPLSVSALHTPKIQHLLWLAREHFGSAVPVATHAKSGQVIADLRDGHANIGLLPSPDEQDPWWIWINQPNMPRIFAHLPGVMTDNMPRSLPTVLAIGHMVPEPSGDDESYFCIMLHDMISMSRLQGIFNDAGLQPVTMQTLMQPQQRSLFVRLSGFHDDSSPAIIKARDALPDASIIWLGAHARPLVHTQAGREKLAV